MRLLLDTNTVSYHLRGVPATVEKFRHHRPSALAISAITAMELVFGCERRRSAALSAAVDAFLATIETLPFDAAAARRAGHVRAALESKGVSLELADSQIAGHALALGFPLVTSDAVFKRVPGLTTRDWSRR